MNGDIFLRITCSIAGNPGVEFESQTSSERKSAKFKINAKIPSFKGKKPVIQRG